MMKGLNYIFKIKTFSLFQDIKQQVVKWYFLFLSYIN
jgi:hypothetical protein